MNFKNWVSLVKFYVASEGIVYKPVISIIISIEHI